jgi:hypothetical protein
MNQGNINIFSIFIKKTLQNVQHSTSMQYPALDAHIAW